MFVCVRARKCYVAHVLATIQLMIDLLLHLIYVRAGACAAAASDGKSVVIFGGAGIGKAGYEGGAGLTAYDETWKLVVDGNTAAWSQLDAGAPPQARVAASLDRLPSGGFLLQGGWDPKSKDTYDVPHLLSLS